MMKVNRIELVLTTCSLFQLVSALVTENRPIDTVAVGVLSRLFATVGLSLFLTYWGTRTNPFD